MFTYQLVHEINDTTRLAADYDDTRYSLQDIAGDGLNVFTVSINDRYSPIDQGNETERLEFIRDSWDPARVDHALGLYLAIKGISFKRVSLRGHSQGDWAEVIVYNSSPNDAAEWLEDPDSFADLRLWFAGDVYRIEYQKLVIYTQLQTGETIERWETQESAFGVPLSWDSNLAQIAADLDLTELAGI